MKNKSTGPAVLHLHGHRTARALRSLADRAERGELLGVAVAAWTHDNDIEMALTGIFERALYKAYYAVGRLMDAILNPG